MQTQVSKLRHVFSLLAPAVPKKHTLDAVKYVRLGDGQAVATDLDVAVSVDLPEAQDGVQLLPFATVENFLRFTPGSLSLGIVSRDGRVHLLARGNEASFPTMDAEEYPPLPSVGVSALSAVVDGDDLVNALAALTPYAATEDTRPVLTTVCLTLQEPMEAATADGFRLAVRTLRSGFPGGEGRRALVPAKAVKVLERLWRLAPSPAEASEGTPIAELVVSRRPILMDCGDNLLSLRFGKVTLLTQLVQGTFPSYQLLIPTEHKSRVTFHAQELLRAVRQVGEVASQGADVVRLNWDEGRLTVKARAEEVGDVEVALEARTEGLGKIAFNVGYLTGYLKGKEGVTTLSTESPSAPGVFTHQGTKVVVMPMFLKDEAPVQPTQQPSESSDEPPPADEAEAPAEDLSPEEAAILEAAEGDEPAEEPKPRRKGRGRKKKE